MTRRIATLVLALLVLALVAAQGANAASPAQIHRDAADGSIDGTYTLQEMRAADRSVPAEIREYYGWEDAYSAYLRRLSNPDAPRVVVPVDSNQNGRIDTTETAAAERKAEDIGGVVGGDGGRPSAEPRDPDNRDEDEVAAGEGEDRSEVTMFGRKSDGGGGGDDDSGGSPLLWMIIGLPVLIVAAGAYRMRRASRGGAAAVDGFGEQELRRARRARRRDRGTGDL